MNIKNYELESLSTFLFSMSLKGKQSRMRTRMIELLNNHSDQLQQDRMLLIEEYSMKDDDGELLFEEGSDNTRVVLIPEKAKEFEAESNILLNEELIIEENESNKVIIQTICEIITDSEIEVSGADSIMYDRWCTIFEEAVERYVSKENEQE